MQPDDTVCFCFHVSLRKIETFCHVEKPRVASQISECLSAGTGCGWCVPMLRHLHTRFCGEAAMPWWREQRPATETGRADSAVEAADYKAGRRAYIADGKGKPPAGAEE